MNSDIADEIRGRGITRICHFTQLASLAAILMSGMVYSRGMAERLGIGGAWNDLERLDDHRDYACCSIQYPNLYVLDEFVRRQNDDRRET